METRHSMPPGGISGGTKSTTSQNGRLPSFKMLMRSSSDYKMSSKAAKKILEQCKKTIDRICGVLTGVKESAELDDLLKLSSLTIDEYFKVKKKEKPPRIDEQKIEQILSQLDPIIQTYSVAGKLSKCLTNDHTRGRIERTQRGIVYIYQETSAASLWIQQHKSGGKKGSTDPFKRTDKITAEDGRKFWETAFGQSATAEFSQFIAHLQKVVYNPITSGTERMLRYCLDTYETGFVTVHKWGDFCLGFSPLVKCIERMQQVFNKEWFHGFMTSADAEKLLERAATPGTFLIRMSKFKPGTFAIAYLNGSTHQVTHTLISHAVPLGFQVEENRNSKGKVSETLPEVVEFYEFLLKIPFKSDITRHAAFWGDIDSKEAESLLNGQPEGTYLFRFTSKPGWLAVSYVTAKEILHTQFERVMNGYKLDTVSYPISSLKDIAQILTSILKFPLNHFVLPEYELQPIVSPVPKVAPGPAFKPPDYGSSSVAVTQGGGGGYGLMPPNASEGHGYGQGGSYGVMPAPQQQSGSYGVMPAPQQQSGSYGVMPAPQQQGGGGYGIMPNIQPTNGGSEGNYGTMPTPTGKAPQNGTYGIMPQNSQNSQGAYGTMPSPQQPHNNYGNMPPTQQQNNYGIMPSPQQNNSQNYGTMPTPQQNNSQNYGTMPTPQQNNSQNYGIMPSPQQIRDHNPQNNYGTMPAPQQQNNSQNYGTMPTPQQFNPQNNYGTMPTPQQQQHNVPSHAQQSNAHNNYGVMPTPQPQQQQQNNSQNYGQMPSPQQVRASWSPQQINKQASSNAQGNYGVMPTPTNAQHINSPQGNYGVMPTPQNKNTPTSPHNNYGHMPTPTSPQNNYGHMPTPISPQNNNNYAHMPTPSQIQAHPQNPQFIVPAHLQGSGYGVVPSHATRKP